jgi:hypothetical protein
MSAHTFWPVCFRLWFRFGVRERSYDRRSSFKSISGWGYERRIEFRWIGLLQFCSVNIWSRHSCLFTSPKWHWTVDVESQPQIPFIG